MVLIKRRSFPWLQLVQTACIAVIAGTLVKIEMRQHHNNRIRTLCAAYWGAPDASAAEKRAGEETKRLVGYGSLEMLSFCRFYGDQ